MYDPIESLSNIEFQPISECSPCPEHDYATIRAIQKFVASLHPETVDALVVGVRYSDGNEKAAAILDAGSPMLCVALADAATQEYNVEGHREQMDKMVSGYDTSDSFVVFDAASLPDVVLGR